MPKTGGEMKMYRNTGTPGTPTWSEVAEVGDVSIPDLARALAELKRRANDFGKVLPAKINVVGVEFRLHHGLDATNFDAMVTNFFDGTAEEWAVMNGDITEVGTQGLRLPAIIENFPWEQNLEDVSGHDVRLACAYMEESGSEVDPEWYTVTV
jgi:hypothetical protein